MVDAMAVDAAAAGAPVEDVASFYLVSSLALTFREPPFMVAYVFFQ